ncbi:MAG: PD40 domain-containing protein [Deltaproteobacteria bacterium]|nr:PD40 domain-containing protein [Deltaproteobacteria bacterium]
MRLPPPLLLAVALALPLTGCRAHQQYFRGVDRALYEVELEELSPDVAAELALDTVEATKARETTEWLTPTRLTSEGLQGRAEWSPDGTRILFQSVRTAGMGANPWEQTYLMDSDGSKQRRLSPGIGKTHGAVIVPGSDDFVVAYGSTGHTGVTPPRETAAVGDSADHEMDLVRQNLSTGATDNLAQGPGFDGEPHFCDDGSVFAFASARTGDLEVYVQRTGGKPQRVTTRDGADESPRLSPDCSKLLWVRRVRDGSELVLANSDGTRSTSLVSSQAAIHTPAFSPDGSDVLFAGDLATPGGTLDLFAVGTDGAGLRRLTFTPGSERTPRVSPDGTTLLFSGDGEGSPQLYASPWAATAGTPWTVDRRDVAP